MHDDDAKVLGDLVDGKSASRRLGIEQDLATVAVDELARQPGGFLWLALGIARNQFNHAAAEAAGRVEFVDFQHAAVAR